MQTKDFSKFSGEHLARLLKIIAQLSDVPVETIRGTFMDAVGLKTTQKTFNNTKPMSQDWMPHIQALIEKQAPEVKAAALGYVREICGSVADPLAFLDFWIDIKQLRCPEFIIAATTALEDRPPKPDSMDEEQPVLSYLIFRRKGKDTQDCTVSKMDIYYYSETDLLPRFRTQRGAKSLMGIMFQTGKLGSRCYSVGRVEKTPSLRFARLYLDIKRDDRMDLRGLRLGESGVAFSHLIYAHQLVTTKDAEVAKMLSISSFSDDAFQSFADEDTRNTIINAVTADRLKEGGLKPDLPEGVG